MQPTAPLSTGTSPSQDDIRTDTIRLVPELRAVHLERHPRTTPALNLYFRQKYDLLGADVPSDVHRVTLVSAARRLFRAREHTLELPEPLWMRFFPIWLLLALAWRAGGFVRGDQRRVVVYAMELTPFPILLAGDHRLPAFVSRGAGRVVGCFIRHLVDRLCFASPSSAELYAGLPGVAAVPRQTILELPEPTGTVVPATPLSATYVGVVAERGGIEPLLQAWELVETRFPTARLTIVGAGPLLGIAQRWASARPATRLVTGSMARHAALDIVASTAVLVAPSVPEGRWREQIGLPIKEGLAAGATIVTTRQSGLAEWLHRTGHHVVDVDDEIVRALSVAISRALESPIERAAVRASLPDTDGRLRSDAWLHATNAEADLGRRTG